MKVYLNILLLKAPQTVRPIEEISTRVGRIGLSLALNQQTQKHKMTVVSQMSYKLSPLATSTDDRIDVPPSLESLSDVFYDSQNRRKHRQGGYFSSLTP